MKKDETNLGADKFDGDEEYNREHLQQSRADGRQNKLFVGQEF